MTNIKSAFEQMLLSFSGCFTKPTFNNFKTITEGWILTPGRKTMTKIIQLSNHMKDKHFIFYNILPFIRDSSPEQFGHLCHNRFNY